MTERLDVTKTYKLFMGGAFPRSESGRTKTVLNKRGAVHAHLCQASRKDLRDAVEKATAALGGWSKRTAYNRGQILYRMGEMLEGKKDEFVEAIAITVEGGKRRAQREVNAAIDRLIAFAGWTDKYTQVLGCQNHVAAPFYNFTSPAPTGVVGVVAPDEQPLLGLISLMAPVVCVGNTAVALGSEKHPLATALLGEVCATSDVPGGVVNLLTGDRDELVEHFAKHRAMNGIHSANLSSAHARTLRLGSAENIKRVRTLKFSDAQWYDTCAMHSPWLIEPFVEMKTIWHPAVV